MPDDVQRLLDQLAALAERLGVSVRIEPLTEAETSSRPGGRCKLRGRDLIIVDSRLGDADRCHVLANALGEMDLSDVYLPPALRELIERTRK